MNLKLSILLLLVCLAMVQSKKWIKGTFKYNGRDCNYYEGQAGHGWRRTLTINCKKYNNQAEFGCTYVGDPHPCRWYNKYQEGYYSCLVNELSQDCTSPCNPKSVECSKKCQEITFDREQEDKNVKQKSLLFEKLMGYERTKQADDFIIGL